jgi:AAA domain
MDGGAFPNMDGVKADASARNGYIKQSDVPPPRILSGKEFLATFVPPDYVIDGIVQRGRLYACTSMTGHGKTAVWAYIACMIAASRHVGTIETVPGDIVLLAGENPADLCVRLRAMVQHFGLNESKLPYVLPANFSLTKDAADQLKKDVDALGLKPVLIVADTAAAYFPGDDDNSNVQMGEYGRNLRILTTCNNHPAVVALSHPIKNPDKENLIPRGGGAFLNELDGNLSMWSDVMGESTVMHWAGKIRGADFAPVHFYLHSVKLEGVTDAKGRSLFSIVAEHQSDESAENANKQAISNENAVLKHLNDQPGISIGDIAQKAGWVNSKGEPMKARVQRALVGLKKEKLVRLYRKKWVITDAGKQELGK